MFPTLSNYEYPKFLRMLYKTYFNLSRSLNQKYVLTKIIFLFKSLLYGVNIMQPKGPGGWLLAVSLPRAAARNVRVGMCFCFESHSFNESGQSPIAIIFIPIHICVLWNLTLYSPLVTCLIKPVLVLMSPWNDPSIVSPIIALILTYTWSPLSVAPE